MLITVTDEHIREGILCPRNCPVALAVIEATGSDDVLVGGFAIFVDGQTNRISTMNWWLMPNQLTLFDPQTQPVSSGPGKYDK